MTGAFAHTADDRFFRPQFIDMQGDGQTKHPRTAALTLGDSHLLNRKIESVTISTQRCALIVDNDAVPGQREEYFVDHR
jgi:hypothetical protein